MRKSFKTEPIKIKTGKFKNYPDCNRSYCNYKKMRFQLPRGCQIIYISIIISLTCIVIGQRSFDASL